MSRYFGEPSLMFDETREAAYAVAPSTLGSIVVVGVWEDYDVYVGKLDLEFNDVWRHTYDALHSAGRGIALDSAENILVVGSLPVSGIDFGGGYLPGPGIFAVKFDPSGNHLWSDTFTGGSAECRDIAGTNSGDFVMGGGFWDPINFGGGTLVSVGRWDAFLAKFAASPTGIHEKPDRRSLELVTHPNPFNFSTTISFTLHERARVTLSIYDVGGKLVRTLVDEIVGEGYQEHVWDGKDDSGEPVASGIYFNRLMTGTQTLTRKTVVLK